MSPQRIFLICCLPVSHASMGTQLNPSAQSFIPNQSSTDTIADPYVPQNDYVSHPLTIINEHPFEDEQMEFVQSNKKIVIQKGRGNHKKYTLSKKKRKKKWLFWGVLNDKKLKVPPPATKQYPVLHCKDITSVCHSFKHFLGHLPYKFFDTKLHPHPLVGLMKTFFCYCPLIEWENIHKTLKTKMPFQYCAHYLHYRGKKFCIVYRKDKDQKGTFRFTCMKIQSRKKIKEGHTQARKPIMNNDPFDIHFLVDARQFCFDRQLVLPLQE